jgi:hypothetical protein
MSESPCQRSPLARLVLFMFSLAIAGSILAGAHYYAVDLPAQITKQPPQNALSSFYKCEMCMTNCGIALDIIECRSQCDGVCP